MFVRYDVELQIEPERVARLFSDDPRAWLPGIARDAHRSGDALLADVGFGEVFRVEREVRLQLGPAIRSSSTTVFPLRWEASEHPGLFPSLDADLEVSPNGPGGTRLGISARYVPPFRALGRALDRAILSRVAQATVRDFLARVAGSMLETSVAPATVGLDAPPSAGS